MGEEAKLSLPDSSCETLAKILHAYALSGDGPVALDTVASKAGMHKTQVSGNNGFLVSIGLLTRGRAKTLTPAGKKIALAIGNGLDEDTALEWRRALLTAPAAKALIDMFRVQKEILTSTLAGRIASTLGIVGSAGAGANTGINCLIDIMSRAGILIESDGKYRLTPNAEADPLLDETVAPSSNRGSGDSESPSDERKKPDDSVNADTTKVLSAIPINVSIELHLPASSEQEVYDALFKSIRENLMI